MEVKVPRDILKYEEALFFGLSLRQFIFAVIAVAVAVGAYFIFNPMLELEMTSWICILAALPFAMLGFVRYNGMSADEFARTWVRSELLFPRVLVFRGSNLYMDFIEQGRMEDARPKRRERRPNKRRPAKASARRKHEKDFISRGRNIYKFRKRGRAIQ